MHGVVAILCSGQGTQHPGMFDLLADCPATAPIFSVAAGLLGKDPRQYVREAGPALFDDRIGQILCCTQALATWTALDAARPERAVIAGYSIGELAAWGCVGAFDADTVLRLAERRATLMEAAAPANCGLAAIVGLRRDALAPILAQHAIAIAIINGVDSFVVGGHNDALVAACHAALDHGAVHAVRLRVAVPSHTPLLATAVPEFRAALREAAPHAPKPGYRLLSGIDGETVYDIETGIGKLARQFSVTVDWAACLNSCIAAGAECALELGPGTALSRMATPLFPEGLARATEDFRTLAGLRAWLQRAKA
jgi:[acyl-carrier-protein] S-malonyltransferase